MALLDLFRKTPVQKSVFDTFTTTPQSIMLSMDYKEIAPTMGNFYSVYKNNADVYRCVEELVQNCAKYGYVIKRGDKEVEDDDITRLITPDFIGEVLQSYLVFGNVFVRILRSPIGIARLQIIDPRYVKIFYDKVSEVVSKYEYKIGTHSFTVNAEDNGQINMLHFGITRDIGCKPWYISPMQTVLVEAMTDYESALSNYSQFKNNILPNKIIVVDPNTGQEQIQEVVDKWKLQMTGGANKHKLAVVSFPIDVQNTSTPSQHMDYSVQRRYSTEKICATYGVPKVILNYTEGVNYTNAEVQYMKFIDNTVRPLEQYLQGWLQQIVNEIDNTYTIEIIDEHTNPLEERATFATEMLKAGIFTVNEAREYMGLEPTQNIGFQ